MNDKLYSDGILTASVMLFGRLETYRLVLSGLARVLRRELWDGCQIDQYLQSLKFFGSFYLRKLGLVPAMVEPADAILCVNVIMVHDKPISAPCVRAIKFPSKTWKATYPLHNAVGWSMMDLAVTISPKRAP